MKENRCRYSGNAFSEVEIKPIIYCEKYFYQELEMESTLFFELRKANNINPYRIIDSTDKELREIKSFFTKNKDSFFLLLKGNELIGSVLVLDNYIQSLCINKQYQRKGFGT
jgi:hypothetical protein